MKAKKLFYTAILVFTSTFTQTSAQNSNPWPTTGPVGIGTSSPNSNTLLHINNGSVLFSGATGTTPVSGAGTRLIWVPGKAAFRAGELSSTNGTHWDDANIGLRSIAMGYDVKANGASSIALGSNIFASGGNSTAIGFMSGALGHGATSLGNGTIAQAFGSVALGSYNVYSGSQTTWVSSDPLFVIGNGQLGAPSNAVTILKDGRMGIGTTTPSQLLHVEGSNVPMIRIGKSGNTNGASGIEFYAGYASGNNAFFMKYYKDASNDRLTFRDGGAVDILTLKNGGNVGIGTAVPNAPLVIRAADGNQVRVQSSNGSGGAGTSGIEFGNAQAPGGDNWNQMAFIQQVNYTMTLKTNGTGNIVLSPGGNVGIGIHAPDAKFQVNAGADKVALGGATGAGTGYGTSYIGFNLARNSSNNWIANNDGANGGASAIYGDIGGTIRFVTVPSVGAVNQSLTDAQITANTRMFITGQGKVRIGTDAAPSPYDSYELQVDGYIAAKKISVSTANWPDYVFENGYTLLNLSETEKHIKEKGHLPGFSSANEYEKSGVDLGEISKKQQEKIEEIFLYLIELKKENEALKKQVEILSKK